MILLSLTTKKAARPQFFCYRYRDFYSAPLAKPCRTYTFGSDEDIKKPQKHT